MKRYVTIWFRTLKTDWFIRRNPALGRAPFVLSMPDHGRLVVTAMNALAQQQGIYMGMAVADARALITNLEVLEDDPDKATQLLKGIAEWFIRYSPWVAIDPPAGLILDATGCAHLWGGEQAYLTDIHTRLQKTGYAVNLAIADTIGAAWAVSRYAANTPIVAPAEQLNALLSLPPSALRLEAEVIDRLMKLGLRQISHFIQLPRTALRRRFGEQLLLRIDQALGHANEYLEPVQPPVLYQERLPCLEPISTATGISIALERLLNALCKRLQQEEKGMRIAVFKSYRLDGKLEQIHIHTNRPSNNPQHVYKLFEFKIATIEPALGIELFILEAPTVEAVTTAQSLLWQGNAGLDDHSLAELLDRIAGKLGEQHIHRFLPAEHYWPERSYKPTIHLQEQPATSWTIHRPRPLQLLRVPQPIEVTAPIPDYPPMLFRHKGQLHKIVQSDGPERIEQEWWLQDGQHRDYYLVEDEQGNRYWLFRLGHYDAARTYQWFVHGFFA